MNWSEWFARLLMITAEKSKDPNSKYAAIIADRGMAQLASGYNGLPRGVDENPERWAAPLKYELVVHAEQNAIFNAARTGAKIDNATMYLLEPPCARCAAAIIQAGIREVVYFNDPATVHPDKPWTATLELAVDLFREAGVLMRRGF